MEKDCDGPLVTSAHIPPFNCNAVSFCDVTQRGEVIAHRHGKARRESMAPLPNYPNRLQTVSTDRSFSSFLRKTSLAAFHFRGYFHPEIDPLRVREGPRIIRNPGAFLLLHPREINIKRHF
ncbi:hypothetical protein AVEN_274646-1 [Araneus ventricosus]|uniref:Uncharacterized protein n=1 Tax=Araneus ventricosus TaxID=182803 RepID=A0A4Y2FGX4_ARAVE|nr:hypothetical protein AVEN_274646-1 [Araneus ventricosus]